MKRTCPQHRVLVIDGIKCLEQAAKQALQTARSMNLNLKAHKDLLNLIYHYFVTSSLDLINSESLKFRSTIVFYQSEFKSQQLKLDFLNILVKKIEKTSPIPVFYLSRRDDVELPCAAERRLESVKSTANALNRFVINNNLTALKKRLKSKSSIFASNDTFENK